MTVDDFEQHGMERLDDGEIRGFLESQSVGVLGVPAEDAPLLRPLSYWFDGDAGLYLPYVGGTGGRKRALSERADAARFLVYRAETAFNWTSVLIGGPIDRVPDAERDAVEEAMETPWRPAVFERAGAAGTTELYRLDAAELAGLRHRGLPPGFDPSQGDTG